MSALNLALFFHGYTDASKQLVFEWAVFSRAAGLALLPQCMAAGMLAGIFAITGKHNLALSFLELFEGKWAMMNESINDQPSEKIMERRTLVEAHTGKILTWVGVCKVLLSTHFSHSHIVAAYKEVSSMIMGKTMVLKDMTVIMSFTAVHFLTYGSVSLEPAMVADAQVCLAQGLREGHWQLCLAAHMMAVVGCFLSGNPTAGPSVACYNAMADVRAWPSFDNLLPTVQMRCLTYGLHGQICVVGEGPHVKEAIQSAVGLPPAVDPKSLGIALSFCFLLVFHFGSFLLSIAFYSVLGRAVGIGIH